MQTFTQWIVSRSGNLQSTMKKNLLLACCLSVSAVSVSAQTLTLKPAKDSWIADSQPGNNYGSTNELVVAAWTTGGNRYICRTFFEFDFSSLPANAVIKSAMLKLTTANPSIIAPAGNKGDNQTYIQMLTAPWTETELTWSNQPGFTSTGQISVGPALSADHVFEIDFTTMANKMHTDRAHNFGFRMVLQTEDAYRNFAIVSKEGADPSLHPTLTIAYETPTALAEAENDAFDVAIFPNPGSGMITVGGPSSFKGEIVNMSGQSVYSFESSDETTQLDLSGLAKGMYFVQLQASDATVTKKLVIE